jgi:hypothetical protein
MIVVASEAVMMMMMMKRRFTLDHQAPYIPLELSYNGGQEAHGSIHSTKGCGMKDRFPTGA